MNSPQAILRLRDVLRRQHKAIATENAYVYWLRRYIASIRSMPESLSSEKRVERFLTGLARRGDVSAATQNQALNAIIFFYKEVLRRPVGEFKALRAKRPVHMRRAPTRMETQRLLATIQNAGGQPTNLVARLLYGCGLRVSEPLNLRIKDIDLEQRRLCIRGAKGGNDRMVALPPILVPDLRQQIQVARGIWLQDQRNRVPVMLPKRLAKKYPSNQFKWAWAWVFPGRKPCRHPRTGMTVRYRMHESNVQRGVKSACTKLGIPVLPHELRHGYATHCLENGISPRAIQHAMGHKSLETTMGYLHAESLSVSSPLEILEAVRAPVNPAPQVPTQPGG
jgi:integron integrase